MDISYQYSKKRCRFGGQPQFCEQGPEMCDSIATNVVEHKNFILRNPVHQPTQHTPLYSENNANTIRTDYSSSGANHAEGGWPKDVSVIDPEATQRYRRKVEKDDNYINCVMSTAPEMDHYVLQNNAIDMYRTYYAEMPSMPELERISCRTVNVYRDGDGTEATRPVSSICWQPDGGQRFAVTYIDVDFNRNARAPIVSYIWNLENANQPEVTFTPPCPLLDLIYNPRDQNLMAGGLVNGQVGVWDARKGGDPTLTCPPHVAHRDLVRNVIFINSKSGLEFFSGGSDGACKWWDIRNMSEPVEEMILDAVKSSFDVQTMAKANGVTALEFEPTMPTRFMAGTENGLIIGGNRKGKTPLEKIPLKMEAHLGPIWSLERNPGFLKNFLTVGDWTARIWSEDCRESPVLWSPLHRHKITAGTWSPTSKRAYGLPEGKWSPSFTDVSHARRTAKSLPTIEYSPQGVFEGEHVTSSLMLLAQWNGTLATWDILRRQHEPVLTMHVCDEPLLRLKTHERGTLVACGSEKGSIFMVELSQTLTQSDKNDKTLLTAVLERESKRERILEARMREIRLKMRQAEEGSPRASLTEPEVPFDVNAVTAEYFAIVKKELAAL